MKAWWETKEGIQWLVSQPQLEEEFKEATKKPRRIGDRFVNLGGNFYQGEYILASVDCKRVALIGLQSGNRWSNPVKVSDVTAITESEWDEISQSFNNERFVKQET